MNANQAITSLLGATVALLSLVMFAQAGAQELKTVIEDCASCHGKKGASTDKHVPIIGGYSAPYIIDSMTAYKNKTRPCPATEYSEGNKKGQKTDMCAVAEALSDQQVKELSAYFAAQKFIRAQQTADPTLAKIGAERHERHCEKCHSLGGSLASDDSGILAGQWIPYLTETFNDYAAGKRTMDEKMKPKMEKLTKDDQEALIQYYGSFK